MAFVTNDQQQVRECKLAERCAKSEYRVRRRREGEQESVYPSARSWTTYSIKRRSERGPYVVASVDYSVFVSFTQRFWNEAATTITFYRIFHLPSKVGGLSAPRQSLECVMIHYAA